MDQVRTFGARALLVATAGLTILGFGCKKESPRPVGATQQELNREVIGTAREHESTQFQFLGLPEANIGQPSSEAPEPGAIGGGPRDESVEPPKTDADK